MSVKNKSSERDSGSPSNRNSNSIAIDEDVMKPVGKNLIKAEIICRSRTIPTAKAYWGKANTLDKVESANFFS
jgi:hypothetical protein